MKSGSNLERVLAAGHFAVTGELGPPMSCDAQVVRRKADILKGSVGAIDITDNQPGVVRGVHIQGIEWEEVVPEIVEGAGLPPRPDVGTDKNKSAREDQ